MRGILYSLIVILLLGCSSNDDTPVVISQYPNVTTVRNNIISKSWIITKFEVDTTVKTSNFNGYVFDFLTNGTLNTTKDNDTFPGTWNTSSVEGITNLNFSIASNMNLSELNKDWDVIESTLLLMRMEELAADGTKYVIELKKQ